MRGARVLIALAAILAAPLGAQTTGTLHGFLTDSSGAAIPGAPVQLTAGGSGASNSVTSGADGSWSFAALPGGDYSIKVEYPGFGVFEKTLTVGSGKTTEFPIQLNPQANKQEVTVSAGPGVELSLDPGSNASGAVVSGSDLDALPDNPDDLADMLAQLAGPGVGTSGAAQILLDGFSGGQLPAKAAIKEIKVNQNPFSADYDNLGFGRIEIVTKPGADNLRGSFGLTDSDAAFNSRNPYADNKADYVNRMLTGNVAGPITKRNSWNLNFQRNIIDNSALINAVTIDPASLASLPVRESVTTPRTDYDVNARFDSQLSTNHTLTGTYRYYLSNRDNNGIGQYNLTSREFSSENSRHEIRLTETAIVNTNIVNDTRFAFTHNWSAQFGNNSDPSIVVAGAFTGGGAQVGPASNLNDNYELQNNTTVVHKTHTIKFGMRARYNAVSDVSPANFGGTFSFFGVTGAPVLDANNQPIPGQTTDISSLEQYRRTLIGAPGGGASQFSIAAGNPFAKIDVADLGAYVLDDWRATPNLTISAGMRYEVQTRIHDLSDWGPRLGIAWSPKAKAGSTPATVIRGGAGIFYNRVNYNVLLPEDRFNGATQQQFVVQNPTFFPNIPSIASLDAAQQPNTTYRLDPHERAMFLLFTAVTVERQLPGKTTVSGNWIHARGVHVTTLLNLNAPFPGTYAPGQPTSGIRPYGFVAGNIFEYSPAGVIDQNVAWVEITNKLNKKVSLTANYQYFISKDDVSFAQPSEPYNLRADYARSPWARPHNFNVIGTLTGPLGLQFSPFIIINSGAPYDLTIGTDLNGTTVANARPAFATDLSRPSVVFTRFGVFDTAPIAGQTIVPRDYLMGTAMWNVNLRVGRTFGVGTLKNAAGEKRLKLNFNIDVNNVFNHLNQGGWVGNLSSPLFGQSTAIYLFRDTSNNRRAQFGTQFSF